MIFVIYLIIPILIILGIFSFWLIICNERTYIQRIKLIRAAGTWAQSNSNMQSFNDLDKISYNKHLMKLALLQDPMKLYPQYLIDFIK